MENRQLQAKSLRDVVDECVQRSPEEVSFRELLDVACRHAGAQAAEAEQPTALGEPSNEAEQRVPVEANAPVDNEPGASNTASSNPAPPAGSPVIVGEVVETQHPLRPGRVLVRWQNAERQTVTEWLLPERHLSLRAGDRVLLALPCGWQEWIVTGALGREPRAPQSPPDHERQVRLQPGEVVRLVAHDGQPLVTVRQSSEGPVVELGEGNVELKAARTLRVSAQTVEINASSGIDLRSDGDTVVRGRTIHLN
jgi:hypothetical protein